ncbi:MAG: hypothetical protein K8F27_01180 [Sulfuricellaceae bacterium]|nr:hypothetical protein [Sulfuricellaceae bacterium]
MTTTKLSVNKLIQDSQDYGSNDEHMVSRVFFDIKIEGTKHEGLYVRIPVNLATNSNPNPSPIPIQSRPATPVHSAMGERHKFGQSSRWAI